MAGKYPYVASAGPLVKTVTHLRKSFPKEVTAETLRKLGVAPKNESYVINVLRFLGFIDDEGKKVDAKAKVLVNHHDDVFAKEFGGVVRDAYEELFELYGDAAWTQDRSTLTQFFRTTDHSSDVVGSRQASTFSALAALSGHAEVPTPKPMVTKAKAEKSKQKKGASTAKEEIKPPITQVKPDSGAQENPPVGLTVRIEVNLPASGDQETYDRIFQSIRKNLING